MKKIFIDRKSVCMADDMESHSATIEVDNSCTYQEAIEIVATSSYLPSYDIMWLVSSPNRGFISACYKSPYNGYKLDIIWQQGFNPTSEICNDNSLFFDCYSFKREMFMISSQYDNAVERTKAKYNISNELFCQIDSYLHGVRKNKV